MPDPSGFELAVGNPNPFANTSLIRFALPKRARATIEIFDVLGRKVRTLIDEELEPNAYERSWDGRSDSDAEVASGIYFVKMAAHDFHATRKITVLR
jgi:flagellar hook assembly protein FlgD